MALKFTRRKAISGIGLGIIGSMIPRWVYSRDIKSPANKIVTFLNPETILENHGILQRIEKAEFDASAGWKLPYRLWTAIGAGQADNNQSATMGYLLIEKSIRKELPGRFNLVVRQKILQQGNRPAFKDFQYFEARIVCKDDDIATPLEWEVEQSIWRANTRLDYCSFTEKGKVVIDRDGIAVRISVNNVPCPEIHFKPGSKLTSDMTLVAALPKMLTAKENNSAKEFIMLEKLRLQKDDHMLFRNAGDDYISDNFGALHKIEHRGNGILPFDYWLDDNGCPLFICTLHNAYIYDLKAEEIVEQICATGKRRQFEN